MKLLLVYRPNSEHARTAEDFVRDYKNLHDGEIDTLDADSPEGVQKLETYDILEIPAILAISNDGQLLKVWTGVTMPLMDEVAGYLRS